MAQLKHVYSFYFYWIHWILSRLTVRALLDRLPPGEQGRVLRPLPVAQRDAAEEAQRTAAHV